MVFSLQFMLPSSIVQVGEKRSRTDAIKELKSSDRDRLVLRLNKTNLSLFSLSRSVFLRGNNLLSDFHDRYSIFVSSGGGRSGKYAGGINWQFPRKSIKALSAVYNNQGIWHW